MPFDSDLFWHRTKEANRIMRNGARRIKRHAKRNISSMGISDTGELASHIASKTKKHYGLTDQVGIRTYRYGIIREAGAGRGWPGGTRTTPNSQKPRTPAHWLSTAFESETPKIADQLSKIKGDDMVDEIDENFKGTLRDRYRIS